MANNGTNGTKTRGAQLDREIDEVLRMRQKKQAAAAPAKPKAAVNPSQAEHERRERASALGRLAKLKKQPLADRKEAQASFFEAMRDDPALVAERLEWLLNGSYGYGEKMLATQILKSPRMNRSAALTQMIGAFEWMAPEDMVRAAWKKLSTSEKAALETAVQGAIASAERDEE